MQDFPVFLDQKIGVSFEAYSRLIRESFGDGSSSILDHSGVFGICLE